MAVEIDEAQRRFVSVMPELQRMLDKPLNEAGTRFKVLDRVLKEVFEWTDECIDPEDSVPDGFVDYTLKSLDGRAVSVIEAKRVGKLTLGSASQKSSAAVLNGSLLKPLYGVILQAANYAFQKGVSTACVTDGRLWLFFQANRRDGLSPLQGKGILFPSLASVANEFPKFHDLISPAGIRDRLNLVQINRAEGIRAAFEEDQLVVSPPGEARMLPRTALADDASLLFSQFFSNITSDSDPEMIKVCFVESPESRKADIELQKIAQKLLNGIETLDTSQSAALQGDIERAVNVMRSERVLLIGNKGSGKTTFLTRFFADILDPTIAKQCLVVRVALEAVPDRDQDQVPGWALRQIRDQLERLMSADGTPSFDELRGIFWSDYNRLKAGPLAPLYDKSPEDFRIKFGERLAEMREAEPERYVQALLHKAVKSDKRLPIIIFDNADQFPPHTQDAIFQLANALSLAAVNLSIVPITDRTVWRLSKTGALQSYLAKSYYLPVPEAKQILQKRIDYVKLKLNDDPELAKSYFSSKGFRVKLDNIDKFAQAVERIFVSNDFVSGLIGRLANFDIRRMLKLRSAFSYLLRSKLMMS
jgi:energy-coupling factor transporter ATP-binding protein EcfA2